MLEAMATLILLIVGAVLMIAVLSYAIFITFYPLSKTVEGGVEATKELAERKKNEEIAQKPYGRNQPEEA
jgi:hypothetical protein